MMWVYWGALRIGPTLAETVAWQEGFLTVPLKTPLSLSHQGRELLRIAHLPTIEPDSY